MSAGTDISYKENKKSFNLNKSTYKQLNWNNSLHVELLKESPSTHGVDEL